MTLLVGVGEAEGVSGRVEGEELDSRLWRLRDDMAMTAEQAQQLMEQMRAVQAQHTAMMEGLDFSRQREQAAAQAAAVDRRSREVAEATARSGPQGTGDRAGR